jgi:hypothetical protein
MARRNKTKDQAEIELEKLLGPPIQIDEEQERRVTEALKALIGANHPAQKVLRLPKKYG